MGNGQGQRQRGEGGRQGGNASGRAGMASAVRRGGWRVAVSPRGGQWAASRPPPANGGYSGASSHAQPPAPRAAAERTRRTAECVSLLRHRAPIEGSRKRRVQRAGERSSSEQRSGDQSYSSHPSTHSLLTSQLVRSSRSAGDQGADQDLPGDQTSGHDDLTNAHGSAHGQDGHGRAAGRAGLPAPGQHRAPSVACHGTLGGFRRRARRDRTTRNPAEQTAKTRR